MRRAYTNTRRAKQAALTRVEITAALVAELAEHGLDYSLQAVADRAGVSLRTVHLHFPDRTAQLAAVAAHLDASAPNESPPSALGDLPAMAARLAYHAFSNPTLLRCEAALGKQRRRVRDLAIGRAAAKQGDAAVARMTAAALSTVLSPETAVMLLDRYKLEASAAEITVTWMVQVLVDAIRNGDVPSSPLKRTRRT
jgi:AcrR family transcriptional regulator